MDLDPDSAFHMPTDPYRSGSGSLAIVKRLNKDETLTTSLFEGRAEPPVLRCHHIHLLRLAVRRYRLRGPHGHQDQG
jgi:hypothetical protein